MNKFDFDFKNIEDVFYEVLGIVNPMDIMSLKMQIRDNLNALSDAIEKKNLELGPGHEEELEAQKRALIKELDSVAKETDLDVVLRKCATIRYKTLLTLDVRVRPEDSYELVSVKQAKRNEIYAVSDLIKSVQSLVDFIKKRKALLSYIDVDNRIIKYSTKINYRNGSNAEVEEVKDNEYPQMCLDIRFQKKPERFSGEYGEVLENAGIYAYDFGDLIYAEFPNDNGEYTQELLRKKLVGVIKKNEFGELKKYPVLINEGYSDIPPEFYRDILFSDVLLRNAKNNLNFLGVPERNPDDLLYRYRVVFNEMGLEDMLRAIHFENDKKIVTVKSNYPSVKGIIDAYTVIKEKMEQAVQELFVNDGEVKARIMGED